MRRGRSVWTLALLAWVMVLSTPYCGAQSPDANGVERSEKVESTALEAKTPLEGASARSPSVYLLYGMCGLAGYLCILLALASLPSLAEKIVWDRGTRQFLGLGLLGPLLLVLPPFFRRRLFRPFRRALLRPKDLNGYEADTYFSERSLSAPGYSRGRPISEEEVMDLKGVRIIKGPIGIGKSMFLRRMACVKYSPTVLLQASECHRGVLNAIGARISRYTTDLDFLGSLILRGDLEILIDSFSEAPPETQELIEQWVEQVPDLPVVIAVRTVTSSQFTSAVTIGIGPLEISSLERFMMRQQPEPRRGSIIKSSYEANVERYLSRLATEAFTKEGRPQTGLEFLRNPLDAVVATHLLAEGAEPDFRQVIKRHYEMADAAYLEGQGRPFPMAAFSERVHAWKKSSVADVDVTGFETEAWYLSDQKLMVMRWTSAKPSEGGAAVPGWQFRSGSVVDFFLEYGEDSTRDGTTVPLNIPLPTVPGDLVEKCVAGECVLYAGAGLNAQAGLPVWRELLGEMIDWALRQGAIGLELGQSLRAAVRQGELEAASESLLDALGKDRHQLYEFLRTKIYGNEVPSEVHEKLQAIPFASVLTTNFGKIIEKTDLGLNRAVYTPRDAEALLGTVSAKSRFILKLYGDLLKPETVILSAGEYEAAVATNQQFSTFLETLFFSRTLLFLGASMYGIEDYLRGIKFSATRSRTHYALVDVRDAGPAWELKMEALAKKYQITVLPYVPTPGHPEVKQFVDELAVSVAKGIAEKETDGALSPSTVPMGRLEYVELTNIGPFERLEWALQPGWNILLGDNGVGKSNVLKAIAFAVCGRDARKHGNRTLRTGSPEGTILLKTSRATTYKTTIRQGDVEAEVVCEPGRPLEAEGWLALGFPPSRVLSWDRPSSAEQRVPRHPSADDSLPLVEGPRDPRMDKVKQWLVNIDYWIKDAREKKGDTKELEMMRDDFFACIGELIGGTKFTYEGIGEGFEVRVRTHDGVVPVEKISQGTASLVGWVAILLQRMYETPQANVPPRERQVIVLVDEIDAHMHPAWQQRIVPSLTKLFPNVQFIATTHSPLIVGGMSLEQVTRLERDADGKIVKAKIDPDMTYGRSDQVLTGDLFKLDSTLKLGPNDKEYRELLAKSSRTESEEKRYKELYKLISTHLPSPGANTKLERRARDLVRAVMKPEQLDSMPADLRDELVRKTAKVAESMGWEVKP